jgi:hypothetical protein
MAAYKQKDSSTMANLWLIIMMVKNQPRHIMIDAHEPIKATGKTNIP